MLIAKTTEIRLKFCMINVETQQTDTFAINKGTVNLKYFSFQVVFSKTSNIDVPVK